jgi:lysozyme
MRITTINKAGIDLISQFEGFSSKPYLCSAKVPTIGYGTTRYPNGKKVTLQDSSITVEQAKDIMRHDVRQFELAVDAMAVDTINQNQFNALVSFAYNVGANALRTSTLLKKVNANPNDPFIRNEFLRWNRAGGNIVAGLTRRREAESNLYFTK